MEMNRLVLENQRLASNHLSLRQDLTAAQSEIQRLTQIMGSMRADNDSLLEKAQKLEFDLLNYGIYLVCRVGYAISDFMAPFAFSEPIKADLHQSQMELQNLANRNSELEQERLSLTQKIHQYQQQNQIMHNDLQNLTSLKQDFENLTQELQVTRSRFAPDLFFHILCFREICALSAD